MDKDVVLSALYKSGVITEDDYMKRRHRLKVRLAVESAPPIPDSTVLELRRLFKVDGCPV